MPIDFKEELILRGWPIGNTSNYGVDIKKNCEKSSNSPQKNKKNQSHVNLDSKGEM